MSEFVIQFWEFNDGDESISIRDDFEDYCRTYRDCAPKFRAFLKALAKGAVEGSLSSGTFLLRGFIYKALKETAAPDSPTS